MIKEKKLEGEEKAQFRKNYAEPLWEDFKLWAASAILGKRAAMMYSLFGACKVLDKILSVGFVMC